MSMQQSPWHNPDSYSGRQFDDDFQRQRDEEHPRGSLGQFIERSTSAPPPSSSGLFGDSDAINAKFGHNNGGSLVGNVSIYCFHLVCMRFAFYLMI
jgi:hypothetical protein